MNDKTLTGELIAKYFARAASGPVWLSRSIAIATLSVAECMFELAKSKVVGDVRSIKESLIDRMEADTDEKKAASRIRLAQAREASNEATRAKARAKLKKIEAETEKTKAETAAVKLDAETRRIQAIAESKAQLLDAISKLRQEGGETFVSEENLNRILNLEPPADDED